MRHRSAKASAIVRVTFQTTQQTRAIAAALTPELQHPAGEKARAKIFMRGKKMGLQFSARDSAALRAIMSSYLRMLNASLNVSNSLVQLESSSKNDARNRNAKA